MHRPRLLLFFLLLCGVTLHAQSQQPWEDYFRDVCALEDVESDSWSDAYEQLCELAEHKIELNSATREDLERLFFLTPAQIEEISEYIYRYAPLRSVSELAMIETLERERRELMQFFVYVDPDAGKPTFPSLKNILKYGRNDLVVTARVPMYDRQGDKNGYLGYKYKHWFKYSYKLGQYFQAGLVGSQDSGEPFFANKNKYGYDHYSFYLIMRKLGPFKTIVLGRYKVKFGMGLILNNGFSFGKVFALSTPNTANALSAYTSRLEANYFQGAAATATLLKGLDLTAFASSRKRDATLDDNGNVTTLLTSGYHRTPTEMEKKHNTTQYTFGGNLRYFNSGFHVGVSSVYTNLSRDLAPNTKQIFRRHYPAGNDFWNVSLDYGYINHWLSIDGETATGDCGAIATINRICYRPNSEWSFTAIQRFYSYKYYSLYSQSFSDGGRIQNESGIYLGASWQPSSRLTLTAYTDYAYFAWPRYQVSAESHSWDNYLSATYTMGDFTLLGRYRLRLRQKDNSATSSLQDRAEHRGRLRLSYTNGTWSASTQGDMAYIDVSKSLGWMVTQNVGYQWRWLSANVSCSYFRTDDYDSRLYSYERDVLYNFSFPMFSGRGLHYTAFLRADIGKRLMVIAKLTTTDYLDRGVISSSYQRIDHSSMTDLDLQLRWKF